MGKPSEDTILILTISTTTIHALKLLTVVWQLSRDLPKLHRTAKVRHKVFNETVYDKEVIDYINLGKKKISCEKNWTTWLLQHHK